MPLCIFLQFKDATWVVDERLGAGVWPLYPVERTWGESLGAKIRRKGFTLLPDYASTAFMIQGATLAAGIADCGDIADYGGLSELMTTYVILSRVKSADGLLLLRAFCPNMFQMGALPGPHCLLKLLRHRFGTQAVARHAVSGAAQGAATHAAAAAASPRVRQEVPGAAQGRGTQGSATVGAAGSQPGATADGTGRQAYGAAEATAEYKQRMAACEVWRAQRKQCGPGWPCGHCGLSFPAEGYGVDRHDTTRLHEGCVGLGHWRCCTACAAVHAARVEAGDSVRDVRMCARCQQERPPCTLTVQQTFATPADCTRVSRTLPAASAPGPAHLATCPRGARPGRLCVLLVRARGVAV